MATFKVPLSFALLAFSVLLSVVGIIRKPEDA
jgi:hypothetical protein